MNEELKACVTPAMVEAVARAQHDAACRFANGTTEHDFPWDTLDDRRKDGMRAIARAAIEALSANTVAPDDAELFHRDKEIAELRRELDALKVAPDDDAEWLREKADLLEAGDPRSAPWAERMRRIAERIASKPDGLADVLKRAVAKFEHWSEVFAKHGGLDQIAEELAKDAAAFRASLPRGNA